MARRKKHGFKKAKISIIRMFHLLPGVGKALAGYPPAGIGGAVPMAISGNMPGALKEFTDVLCISYTGYKPSDGSWWLSGGKAGAGPIGTYLTHGAIEVTRWVLKKCLRGSFKFGPFMFP